MPTVIADHPPDHWYGLDGEIDCQCARCGSSMHAEPCYRCGGEGVDGHDCGEDCCCCLRPLENVVCDECRGIGHHWFCLSSLEFCEATPLPGREDVPRGKIEWIIIENNS